MKDIYELANTTTSDVSAITPKIIATTIEEIRRGKRVFAQFYRQNDDLQKMGGKEIEFPKKGSAVAVTTNMSEGQTIDTTKMTYTSVTIPIKKHGIALGFTGESLRQVKRDIIRDHLQEAGETWADAMETIALEAMFPTTIATATIAQNVTLDQMAVGIKSATNLSSIAVNSATQTVLTFSGAGTAVIWYAPSSLNGEEIGAKRVSVSSGSLSAKDIWNAKADILAKNFDPDVMVVHPFRLSELFYDSAVKFVEAWAYRGAGPVMNGEIGQMWGLKVIVSTKCPIYSAILIDTKNLGYEVKRMPLTLQENKYCGMQTDTLYFYGVGEINYGVVNAGAYGAVAVSGTLQAIVNPTR